MDNLKELYGQLDEVIAFYDQGTVDISDDIPFEMPKLVKQITHYILSRYTEGGPDNVDPLTRRRRPFDNIGNFIVDLEWRAKNLDRKNIVGQPNDEDYIFAMVVNKELQQELRELNFGKTIDDYQRKKSQYGSVLMLKTETKDELNIEPVQWSTMKVDPRDITNGPKIMMHYLTPLELMKKIGVWDEAYDGESGIDAAIRLFKRQRNRQGENRIEIWDIEAEFQREVVYPEEDTDADGGEGDDDEGPEDTIGLFNVICAVVNKKKILLYREELTESRYKHFKRKEVEGRDFGVGVWEEVMEPQIWRNEAVISEHEAMSIASKVVITTNKKGLPSAMELMNGEIVDLEVGEFFKSEPLMSAALPELSAQIQRWMESAQRNLNAYPAMTGQNVGSVNAYRSIALQAQQGQSFFNKLRDQDGYDMLEVLIDWVLSFVIKRINKDHKLTASYSPDEIKKIHAAIVADHTHTQIKAAFLNIDHTTPLGKSLFPNGFPSPQKIAAQKQSELDAQGDTVTLFIPKGYITIKKIKEKMRFDITDEMSDTQKQIQTITNELMQLPPGDPARAGLMRQLLSLGDVSPASFPINDATPQAVSPVEAAGGPTGTGLVNPKALVAGQ